MLEVRPSTLTAIIFTESRQPSVNTMVKKRQLKFWLDLRRACGTELNNSIERVKNTKYIQYYMDLETLYTTPDEVYSKLNSTFYNEMWKQISAATFDQLKLKTYQSIYNYSVTIPDKSICLRISNPLHNRLVTKYISSSHDLENEKGRQKRQQ